MADSKAHAHLSVTPPNQISKDLPGADSSIPLSPQWLHPKPVESKVGMAPGENHSSLSGYNNRADTGKIPLSGEKMHDSHKKKDVYRPTFLESESARRDRWRDEERDTNVSIRRDRRREGDREFGDTRKMDRWADNSSMKNFGEARRPPSERWVDPSREAGFDQRRENKWNTRWGPDDKEMDKWSDSAKHADASHDRGFSHLINHGKDVREGDNVKPWRPTSAISRGRSTDALHFQPHISSKEGHSFGHGRVRGDNAPATYSLGRGRANFDANSVSKISPHSLSLQEADDGHGEPSPCRYSRTKLLDLYRVTDIRSLPKLLNGFSQVPSLTQEQPVEPLALSSVTPEELAILKGIDKGDIISSGAPQVSKDGSAGRGSSDFVQIRRPRLGSRDDISLPIDNNTNHDADDPKDAFSGVSVGSFHDKQTPISLSNLKLELIENHQNFADSKHNIKGLRDGPGVGKADDLPRGMELNIQESTISQSSMAWKSSVEQHARSSAHDWFDVPAGVGNSEVGWSEAQKVFSTEFERGLAKSSYPQGDLKWQTGDDPSNRRQESVIIDRELEARSLFQPAPEDLILTYKDPQGQIQGPFSGGDIIGWFEHGYFGIDLPVRLANAPADSPFALLGDVMPHLRAKARPPPGFSVPKLNEIPDMSTRPVLGNFGNVITGPNGIDMLRNEHRHARGSTTEAENRFLESLMSSSVSNATLDRFSTSEGPQGYAGHNSSVLPPLGMESGDSLNLFAKRLTLERQRSLSNPYPNWPVKDASSMVPQTEMLQDSSISQPKVLSTLTDLPRQPSHPQNVDMMGVLQGLPDRSSVSINNGVAGWSNFPVPGGLDPFKEKIDLHYNQSFPPQAFGLQQQRVQPQNHPSLANLLGQNLDNPSTIHTPEKLLSSGVYQDPQMLNLLHQQYLLQMQSQSSLPAQQLSLLDKVLLLKQQQKQEEQLRQQQQLLSQVMTEHQQRFGEPSYGQLHPAVVASVSVVSGSTSVDNLHQMIPQQTLQVGSEVPVSSVQEDRITNFANMPQYVPQDISYNVGSETSSMHVPHQISGVHQKNWATIPAQDGEITVNDSSIDAAFAESLSKSEAVQGFQVDSAPRDLSVCTSTEHVSHVHVVSDDLTSGAVYEGRDPVASGLLEISDAKISERSVDNETSVPEKETDAKVLPSTNLDIKVDQSGNAVSTVKEVKNVEVREVRKTSEKKLRKQKSSKAQSSSEQKSSLQQLKPIEAAVVNASDTKSDVPVSFADSRHETVDAEKIENASFGLSKGQMEHVEVKGEVESSESVEKQNTLGNSVQRVWKPAANVKPKSLLEIQQEEERKLQTEITVSAISSSVSTLSLSASWAGVDASSEPKISREVLQDGSNSKINVPKTENSKAKKSQLHDLLAAEVLAKSRENETAVVDAGSVLPSMHIPNSQAADKVDDDFIEAKDTKKSRKKAGKTKGSGSKSSTSVSSIDVIASSPIERSKSSRQMQQERELLPAPPVGPSLGDFVPWKGETSSPSPAPAWSMDSGKLPKPTSLRDILREQERKGVPTQQQPQLPTPQKSQSTHVTRTGSWSLSGTSPSKAAAPIQINSHASPQTKYKADDDLFWGPPEQSKQEVKKADFPNLGNDGSRGTKSTPVKASSGVSLSSQKSAGRKAVEILSSPASAQSSLKGKRDGDTNRSEAREFRSWCESESVRLTGSKDTSFLEFCLKQSRSEAEILLIQNLGGLDPNHEFIDKFLKYMDMLPADVLEIAFQGQNDRKAIGWSSGDMASDNVGMGDCDAVTGGVDGSAKVGKKKGKKGKKVSPSVLGFSVVSNRIMMGEIQTVDD